jgi:hypothetical protein
MYPYPALFTNTSILWNLFRVSFARFSTKVTIGFSSELGTALIQIGASQTGSGPGKSHDNSPINPHPLADNGNLLYTKNELSPFLPLLE